MGATPQPRIFTWYVAWSNPQRARPEGFPECIMRIEQERPAGAGAGPCPAEIHECWQEMRPYGYAVFCEAPYVPARQLSAATKQRIRRRNLWKRLLSKYPMFVSDWYAEQVQAKSDYYGSYIVGEWADVQFARTTMGYLKQVQRGSAHLGCQSPERLVDDRPDKLGKEISLPCNEWQQDSPSDR